MFNVYIREAHPADGWSVPCPDGKEYKQPTTLEERMALAKTLVQFEGAGNLAQIPMLVDDPSTDALFNAYEAGPERIVILDRSLEVAYMSGQGPFQYDIAAVKDFLRDRLDPSKASAPCQFC
mmetsp:Transcript_28960/g.63379  ORF Transcript_28960/g.63379 Transcript_28960/m.63379 type:complete len:122 (-) Transcript_28960:440-805(-)